MLAAAAVAHLRGALEASLEGRYSAVAHWLDALDQRAEGGGDPEAARAALDDLECVLEAMLLVSS